jgi:hypothetical protein
VNLSSRKGHFSISVLEGNVGNIAILLYECPVMIKQQALSLRYASCAITSLLTVWNGDFP